MQLTKLLVKGIALVVNFSIMGYTNSWQYGMMAYQGPTFQDKDTS